MSLTERGGIETFKEIREFPVYLALRRIPGLASHWLGAHNERFAPIWCVCLEDYPDSPFVTQRTAFFMPDGMESAVLAHCSPFLTNNPNLRRSCNGNVRQ
jgi:hypothetical protein